MQKTLSLINFAACLDSPLNLFLVSPKAAGESFLFDLISFIFSLSILYIIFVPQRIIKMILYRDFNLKIKAKNFHDVYEHDIFFLFYKKNYSISYFLSTSVVVT